MNADRYVICYYFLKFGTLIESKHYLFKRVENLNRAIGRQVSSLLGAKSSDVYFLPCLGEGMKNGRDKQGISVGATVQRVVFSIKVSSLTLNNLRTTDIYHEVKSVGNRVALKFP